ncbi:MAG TPA: gliding motility-associated C-terminal domain-containing protein, partial [Bacteroidales bacterium]|nr:gliding motility-associated C-terminal domain-containing protein [Bacteroidales bacterium]
EILLHQVNIAHVTGCTGNNNGALDFEAIGGSGTFEFSMDGGAFQPNGSFSGLTAGDYTITTRDDTGCENDSVLTVTEPQPITIDSSKNVPVDCFGSSSGELKIYASGGTMPLTYSISPGSVPDNTNGNFTALPAGDYTVTVNDSEGCTPATSNTITITQPDPLAEDSINITKITCNNAADGKIVIYVSGGVKPYEYSIDNKTTFLTDSAFTGLTGDTYQLSVSDARGCELDLGSYTLINPDPVTINANVTNVTTCNGEATGAIEATATGGWIPYEYSLDGTIFQSSGLFDNLLAGEYTIYARDSLSCQTNTTITINEPDPVTATIAFTNYEDGVLGTINISGESGGTPPYEYGINGVSGAFGSSSNFTDLQAGLYEVVTMDANGCTYMEEIEILEYLPLSISIDSTNVSCYDADNGSIILHPSDESGTVQYSIDGGATFTTDTLFTNLPGDSLYQVQAYDEAGKEYYDSVYISEPPEIIVNENITPANCNAFSSTGSIDLNISGGSGDKTVTWSDNSTAKNLSNIESGWYHFSVTDTASCVKHDSAFVPSIVFIESDAGKDTTVCAGSTLALNGSPGSVVSWEPSTYLSNQTIPTPVVTNITEPTTFIYTVSEVASGFNCYDIDTVSINVLPVYGINVNQDTTILHGQSAQLSAYTDGIFNAFEWIPATGLNNSTSDSPIATPQNTITYYLLATNDNGCTETDSVTIEVIQDLRISNVFSPNDDNLNDYFYIENASSFPELEISIYSRWGERIFYSKGYGTDNRWDGTFKGKDVPLGTYYYIIMPIPGGNPVKGNVTVIR